MDSLLDGLEHTPVVAEGESDDEDEDEKGPGAGSSSSATPTGSSSDDAGTDSDTQASGSLASSLGDSDAVEDPSLPDPPPPPPPPAAWGIRTSSSSGGSGASAMRRRLCSLDPYLQSVLLRETSFASQAFEGLVALFDLRRAKLGAALSHAQDQETKSQGSFLLADDPVATAPVPQAPGQHPDGAAGEAPSPAGAGASTAPSIGSPGPFPSSKPHVRGRAHHAADMSGHGELSAVFRCVPADEAIPWMDTVYAAMLQTRKLMPKVGRPVLAVSQGGAKGGAHRLGAGLGGDEEEEEEGGAGEGEEGEEGPRAAVGAGRGKSRLARSSTASTTASGSAGAAIVGMLAEGVWGHAGLQRGPVAARKTLPLAGFLHKSDPHGGRWKKRWFRYCPTAEAAAALGVSPVSVDRALQ